MDGPRCAWGPRLHIRKRFTHAHTRTPALPFTPVDVDPSVCQASGTPSTRQSSIDSPIWREEAGGLARLHLSVSQLTALGGGPPPFPSHQLCWQVQAGKGLPLHPIHAHQHIWWMWAGGGCPQSLSTVGQAHLCPGWAQARAVSQFSVTGGGRPAFPAAVAHDSELRSNHTDSQSRLGPPWIMPGHLGWTFRQAYRGRRVREGGGTCSVGTWRVTGEHPKTGHGVHVLQPGVAAERTLGL